MTKQINADTLNKLVTYEKEKNKYEDKIALLCKLDNDKNIEICITPTLSAKDMNFMVNGVVNAIIDGNIYNSSLEKLVFYQAILAFFTNIDTENIHSQLLIDLIYNTDIVNKIYERINKRQIADIENAITKALNFRKDQIITSQEQKLNENSAKLDEYIECVKKLTEQFNENLSGADIKKLIKSTTKLSNLSEEKIADKIIQLRTEENGDK